MYGKTYSLRAEAREDRLTLRIGNETVLEARDGSLAYGMLGVCQGEGTASRWSGFHIAASV